MERVDVALIGDGAVGKSSLADRFVFNAFDCVTPMTMEESYIQEITVDGKKCKVYVLDTAGQEEYSALRDQYMRTSESFLIVYSITRRGSFDAVDGFVSQIARVRGVDLNDVGRYYPIVLVGNKSDLEAEREVQTKEGENLARSFGWKFFETSAKTGSNVVEAFTAVAGEVLFHRMNKNGNPNDNGKKPGDNHDKKKCIIC